MVALGLGAVVPDGFVVNNGDLVDVGVLALGSDKVEAGKEAGAVGERLAGMSKVRLSDGVVGSGKVPLDGVANFSYNVLGIEVKTTASNNHGVGDAGPSCAAGQVVSSSRSARWSSRNAGNYSGEEGKGLGSEHFDVWLRVEVLREEVDARMQ